jgi:hypothetical protein
MRTGPQPTQAPAKSSSNIYTLKAHDVFFYQAVWGWKQLAQSSFLKGCFCQSLHPHTEQAATFDASLDGALDPRETGAMPASRADATDDPGFLTDAAASCSAAAAASASALALFFCRIRSLRSCQPRVSSYVFPHTQKKQKKKKHTH